MEVLVQSSDASLVEHFHASADFRSLCKEGEKRGKMKRGEKRSKEGERSKEEKVKGRKNTKKNK